MVPVEHAFKHLIGCHHIWFCVNSDTMSAAVLRPTAGDFNISTSSLTVVSPYRTTSPIVGVKDQSSRRLTRPKLESSFLSFVLYRFNVILCLLVDVYSLTFVVYVCFCDVYMIPYRW